MPPIALTPEQERLRDQLLELLDHLMHLANQRSAAVQDEIDKSLDEMAEKAGILHGQFMSEGQEPRYSLGILTKRGMSPKSAEFYRNMYAVECLLDFIENGSLQVKKS